MNLSKSALSTVAAGLAVLAILAWRRPSPPVISQATPAVKAVPAATVVLTERDPHSAPTRPEVVRESGPASSRPLSKSEQIDALVKTKDPTDAYAAYQLVHRCLFSRANEVRAVAEPALAKRADWVTPGEACGDISPGQITSRLQWLNIAADAGVHGAAEDVNHEGPDGDWRYARNSPLMNDWNKRSAMQSQAAIASGDPWALGGAWAEAAGKIPWIKPNPWEALKFAVAWQEVLVAQTGRTSEDGLASIEALKASLPPDQAAAAIAAGEQIVVSAKTSPYWRRH